MQKAAPVPGLRQLHGQPGRENRGKHPSAVVDVERQRKPQPGQEEVRPLGTLKTPREETTGQRHEERLEVGTPPRSTEDEMPSRCTQEQRRNQREAHPEHHADPPVEERQRQDARHHARDLDGAHRRAHQPYRSGAKIEGQGLAPPRVRCVGRVRLAVENPDRVHTFPGSIVIQTGRDRPNAKAHEEDPDQHHQPEQRQLTAPGEPALVGRRQLGAVTAEEAESKYRCCCHGPRDSGAGRHRLDLQPVLPSNATTHTGGNERQAQPGSWPSSAHREFFFPPVE